jgi:hypothetical protein
MVTDCLDSGYRIESGTSFTGVTTFYEFIKFISSDAPPYPRNVGKDTEVKTNRTFEPGTIEPVNWYISYTM